MRKYGVLLPVFLISFGAIAQSFDPTILILAPNETSCDKKLTREFQKYNKTMSDALKSGKRQSSEDLDRAENIKAMIISEETYTAGADLYMMTSDIAFQYLATYMLEQIPETLILLSKTKSNGDASDLKRLADESKTQYVFNIKKIELSSKGGKHVTMRIQLFDSKTGEYLIDNDFVGDELNQGLYFTCSNKSVVCTLNNALSKVLPVAMDLIISRIPDVIRKRKLSEQRYKELATNYLPKPFDLSLLKEVVKESIPLDNVYQVLYDESKAKFVAFSLNESGGLDLKTVSGKNGDSHISIKTSNSIMDGNIFSDTPKNYAFVIYGVKYNNEWFYKKGYVTYFETTSPAEGKLEYLNSLQEWNFFESNTTTFNPNFWETGLFKKVPDLREDPEWKKYGESSWKTNEANQRSYIGIYEVVADALRERKKKENEKILEKVFVPFFEKMVADKKNGIESFSDHHLIAPSTGKVMLSPVTFKDEAGNVTLRYYVFTPESGEMFEWTYLSSIVLRKNYYVGAQVVDQMETITEWNFSYDAQDDEVFWEKYVLLKENGKYRYLKEVK